MGMTPQQARRYAFDYAATTERISQAVQRDRARATAAPRLDIWTARISYGGEGRLDVTRKGNSPFAPSWTLLNETKARVKREGVTEAGWTWYRKRYVVEMRRSWRHHRAAWDELLSRLGPEGAPGRVVLCCYCTDYLRCHRSVLAELLVAAGGDGVLYHGEIEA